MKRRRALLAGLAASLSPWSVARDAAPAEIDAELPQARLIGQARLRWFGLHVYDIRLWSPAELIAGSWAERPLALELQYARSFDGQDIAERSIAEMRRQAALPDQRARAWRDEMARLFPDVRAGDRLTGVMRPGEGARFFYNGHLRGELRESDFARLFFGIWLAPQTSEPGLRTQLLGLAR